MAHSKGQISSYFSGSRQATTALQSPKPATGSSNPCSLSQLNAFELIGCRGEWEFCGLEPAKANPYFFRLRAGRISYVMSGGSEQQAKKPQMEGRMSASATTFLVRRPSALLAIWWAGFSSGVLDITAAFLVYGLFGASPIGLLQG